MTRYVLMDIKAHTPWPFPPEYPAGFPTMTDAELWGLLHIPDGERRGYRVEPIAEAKA